MSNHLAISAVTLTLRDLLTQITTVVPSPPAPPLELHILSTLRVSMVPPNKVRELFPTENVVNLFLYRTDINAALRNHSLGRAGESAQPPLALNLEYLVTSYGEGESDVIGQFFLGQAMRVLHDNAILARERIRTALEAADLHRQTERVTITPKALSIEEMSKLWSVLGTNYRISAMYVVTVVLIDSLTPVRSAPPVLQRGPFDRGNQALAAPSPLLTDAQAASGLPAARLGEDLVINGQNLDLGGMTARIHHPQLAAPIVLTPRLDSATQISLHLPAPGDVPHVPANWPAGFYTLSLVVTRPGLPPWTTNEVSFALAPSITISVDTHAAGTIHVSVDAIPEIHPDQRVVLLFGHSQATTTVPALPAGGEAPTSLVFPVTATAGMHRVRLRVDGVDSIPVIRNPNGYFEFDDAQSVVVT
jgi:hypothetical protein